ncbi:MAG: hypothetical protein E5Y12_09090 [Mesorhizobium sp.]|nr:MAG: hypothetical protein E5Y12_09090 [Mesorhizobium sp.]
MAGIFYFRSPRRASEGLVFRIGRRIDARSSLAGIPGLRFHETGANLGYLHAKHGVTPATLSGATGPHSGGARHDAW